MFHFESCENTPEEGGRAYGGGGLVEVEGRVVWGGVAGGVYMLEDKDKWKRWTGGSFVAVGGWKDGGVDSKKVMVWRGGGGPSCQTYW